MLQFQQVIRLPAIRTLYKSSVVRLVVAVITIIAALAYRRSLVREFHALTARMLSLSFAHHPSLVHFLHVARNITPDLSVVLLALAGLSYLMPEAMMHIEKHKALRRSIAFVLMFFGLAVIILNEVAREDREKKDTANGAKLDAVSDQNGQILQAVLADRTVPEVERKRRIENSLRNEYILHHSDISPAMLAGIEYPPAAWMNDRLRQLGENWTFGEPPLAAKISTQPPQIIREVLPEPKKATIQFSFYQDASVGFPFTEITVPADGVKVSVSVTAKVTNDVAAQRGQIWLRVPETSGWMSEPEGFTKDANKPKDRSFHFDLMLPNVVLPKIELNLLIPIFPNSDNFQIAGYYGCENCDPVNPGYPQILTVHVVHPKLPKQ